MLRNLNVSGCLPSSLRQRTETDSLELSGLLENFEEAQAFRATTLDSVRMYLALDCNATNQDTDATQKASRRSILEQFAPVGRAMVKHCTLGKYLLHIMDNNPFSNGSSTEQRRALMKQIKLFVDMSELDTTKWTAAVRGGLPAPS